MSNIHNYLRDLQNTEDMSRAEEATTLAHHAQHLCADLLTKIENAYAQQFEDILHWTDVQDYCKTLSLRTRLHCDPYLLYNATTEFFDPHADYYRIYFETIENSDNNEYIYVNKEGTEWRTNAGHTWKTWYDDKGKTFLHEIQDIAASLKTFAATKAQEATATPKPTIRTTTPQIAHFTHPDDCNRWLRQQTQNQHFTYLSARATANGSILVEYQDEIEIEVQA